MYRYPGNIVTIDDSLPPDLYSVRLQGPWRLTTAASPDGCRIQLPVAAAGLGVEVVGSASLHRSFHRPTNLDPEERVLLLLPLAAVPVRVLLGPSVLPRPRSVGKCLAWDLTDLLQPSNRLRIDFDNTDWQLALQQPVLIGIMPDADGTWWASLPEG